MVNNYQLIFVFEFSSLLVSFLFSFQEDFLDLRLGVGSTELKGKISAPEEHFSLKSDTLLDEVYKVGTASRTLENVPISLNFVKSNIIAIIGAGMNKKQFIEGLRGNGKV